MQNKEMALVTGASGFVGQHLCQSLVSAGWSVRGFCRSPRPENLFSTDWVQGDVTDFESVTQAITDCNAVIHLACLPMNNCALDPTSAEKVNVGGTVKVLEASRRANVDRIIFTSSGQIYGGQAPMPNNEGQTAQPDSAYAASKRCAEIWCEMYTQTHNVPVIILRLFNVYGPSADGKLRPTVESIFLQRIAQGKRPLVKTNPQSGRDFIYVSDVVTAITKSLITNRRSFIINIGTGVLTTLHDLATAAANVLDKNIEPNLVDTHAPMVRFQADTARAEAQLGFRPTISLENGLRTIAETI